MPDQQEWVTVFRSADPDAEEQVEAARETLQQAGMTADVFDDSKPGVPDGAFEVRVRAEQKEDAERLLETPKDVTPEPADLSHDLDMVPVFVSESTDAEMLAAEIRSILEERGIPSVLASGSMFPSLPFEVRVPKARLDDARRAILAAEAAGPEAAEEAERESEEGGA